MSITDKQFRQVAENARRGMNYLNLRPSVAYGLSESTLGCLGVPAHFCRASFSNCDLVARELAPLKAWCADPHGCCLLWGRWGTGKTHVAVAMLREVAAQGQAKTLLGVYPDARFITEGQYINALAKSFETHQVIIRRGGHAGHPWLLILDDFGSPASDNRWANQFGEIINQRYAADLPTILTSNMGLDEIARRFHPRVSSRIVEGGHIYEFGGRDLRLPKKGGE